MNLSIKILLLFLSFSAFGQVNLLNADRPEEIGVLSEDQKKKLIEKKFLEYPHVDEHDVMWSKIVYEEIDLSEKFNHPLFFPADGLYTSDRRSLWKTILEGIKDDSISNFYLDTNANFNQEITKDDVVKKISNSKTANGKTNTVYLASSQIYSYLIKGVWYVDKRIGEMRYRLLGIMPYGIDLKDEDKGPVPLFWLWYKDLRPVLHEQLVFDDRNNVSRISFDQLLTSRRFTARIIGVDNVFDDQPISDYVTDPFMQLIESERLKSVIRDFEQDLWSN